MSQSLGKEMEDGNRGQKRKADEALFSATDQQQNPCKLVELPQDVLCHILSFQTEKDVFSLSTMCGVLWKAVEAFSERALEEIKTKHKVDDTWEARIRDKSSIETDMEGPLELPNRYLLWKARRTHLYTLDTTGDEQRIHFCAGLGALPDGKRLVGSRNDNIIRMWDLSTKRNHVICDGNEEGEVNDCFLHEEYIVATIGGSVRIFSLDGRLVFNVEPPEDEDGDRDEGDVSAISAGQEKMFFRRYGSEESIYVLDLVTGAVREEELSWREETDLHRNLLKFLVCGSMLLVIEETAGIHVFDTINFSLRQFLPGDYVWCAKATDDPNTVVATDMETIYVLALKDELLHIRFSFPCPPRPLNHNLDRVLLVHQSLAFVSHGAHSTDEESTRKTIAVYNILNGERVHTYYTLAMTTSASTNGHELFFGFNLRNNRDFGAIRAYPLPSI